MAYIEKDKAGTYFNPVSNTTVINPDSSSSNTYTLAVNENEERWSWLINGWANMTFKERLALFLPYLHYVNVRDFPKAEFDDAFQTEAVENAYKLCRMFKEFKFDPDGQGTPNLIMVFEPIDIDAIPNANIKSAVKCWATKIGLIKKCCCHN